MGRNAHTPGMYVGKVGLRGSRLDLRAQYAHPRSYAQPRSNGPLLTGRGSTRAWVDAVGERIVV
jgi:hypothetical protein